MASSLMIVDDSATMRKIIMRDGSDVGIDL